VAVTFSPYIFVDLSTCPYSLAVSFALFNALLLPNPFPNLRNLPNQVGPAVSHFAGVTKKDEKVIDRSGVRTHALTEYDLNVPP
jgi:hypothetical protein